MANLTFTLRLAILYIVNYNNLTHNIVGQGLCSCQKRNRYINYMVGKQSYKSHQHICSNCVSRHSTDLRVVLHLLDNLPWILCLQKSRRDSLFYNFPPFLKPVERECRICRACGGKFYRFNSCALENVFYIKIICGCAVCKNSLNLAVLQNL